MGKTIVVDFDGVINSYASGWQGIDQLPDPPVPGAMAWLQHMIRCSYDVCIFSSRSKEEKGIAAMKSWFVKWGFDRDELNRYLSFPTTKPAAWLTIDDRCLTFQGVFPTVDEIEAFKPWHQKVVKDESQ